MICVVVDYNGRFKNELRFNAAPQNSDWVKINGEFMVVDKLYWDFYHGEFVPHFCLKPRG